MKKTSVLVLILSLTGVSSAQAPDAVHDAANAAIEQARAALEQAPKLEGIQRIGVAAVENDPGKVTDLLRSALTRTRFNIVLTSDADWAPLLDEFARQVRREDLILPETAHRLRVQGVDAVLYGETLDVTRTPIEQGDEAGERVTVRLLLHVASLDEASPGSLMWSEPFTGTAEALSPMTPEQQAVSFARRHRLAFIAGTIVLALIVLSFLYRRAIQPR